MLINVLQTSKPSIFVENHAMKNQFLRLNDVENVSNMSQSVWKIIIHDQKHILYLNKSHKGRLKKSASPPLKNSHIKYAKTS